MERNVTIICTAADTLKAQAFANNYPGGTNFSVPLFTMPGQTNRNLATHWACSGFCDADMVAAFEVSVDPIVNVTSNENTDFNTIIANRSPQLFRLVEEL